MSESGRRFKGRNVLVTGGGRRIGKAISLGFAREGATVVVVARTPAQIEAVAEEIRGTGGRALALVADVTRKDEVDAACEKAVSALGGIDILVNNAGINKLGRFVDQPAEEWWAVVQTSLAGAYNFSRALLPQMERRGWGRIINIGSRASKVGHLYSTSYCSAKHALLGFTRALALEVATRGVTVNAVCPGLVTISDAYWGKLSELTGTPAAALRENAINSCPQKKEMVPADIVPAVLFLATEEAGRTTGDAINVSGGMVMH